MSTFACLSLVVFIATSTPAIAESGESCATELNIPCPDGWVNWRDSCYTSTNERVDWFTAHAICRHRNAVLAAPANAEENSFLRSVTPSSAWINCHDHDGSETWTCLDGNNQLSYDNWFPGEPNSYQGNTEDCADIAPSGYWFDTVCETKLLALCKRYRPKLFF